MTTEDPQHHKFSAEASADDNVVYLPAANTEDGVVEAEIVDDIDTRRVEPSARATFNTHLIPDEARERMASGAVELSHRATPVAKSGGKALVRHGAYVVAGALVVAKRVWDAHSNSRYERLLRSAEASSDWDKLAEWEQRAEQARERRHRRAMDWLDAPVKLVKTALWLTLAVAGVFLALGVVLAIAQEDARLILGPLGGVLDAIQWAYWFALAYGVLFVYGGTAALVAYLWRVGRDTGITPGWLQTAGEQSNAAVVVDETAIAHALAHLGLTKLDGFFKSGGMLSYPSIPARDGLGVAAQVRLPPGVPAEQVIARKTRLAANLGRAGIEVWPSVGADEGLLQLWVADRGALDTGAGPWPWLDLDTPVDIYRGIPVGVTLRGDAVIAPINGTSWLVGGRPGQGKTTFGRLLVMGACLDPTAEIWVHVLADNPDFDALAERFTRYEVGIGHDVAAAALAAFEDLMAEIERRGQIMRAKQAHTAAEAGLPPLVAYFDEVHRLFQHREFGEEAARLAEDVIKQARKYGVVVILVTQSPTAGSIPKPVTRETICRVAFSVIDQIANDALLGDGKHRQGIRATELRPGSDTSPGDRGKALTVGVVPEVDWSMVIGHNVGSAEVTHVGRTAMSLLAEQGRSVPADSATAHTKRDLLDDLDEVLDTERVPAGDLPARLRRLAPDYKPYQQLTRKKLLEQLRELGIKVPSTDNRWYVDPVAIRRALAERATADLDQE
ncbi:cell division protein FtsK [Haloechinothrix salitolerans]|uniref:Cell division protein FtsK n=1 Tax=Haloechinothrix salitolerans TaxID=926830 RepID=A0ABW2CA56_9PSEU